VRTRIQRIIQAVAFFMIVALGVPMLAFTIADTRAQAQELLDFEAQSVARYVQHTETHSDGDPSALTEGGITRFLTADVHARVFENDKLVFEGGAYLPTEFIEASATFGTMRVELTRPVSMLDDAITKASLVAVAVAALAAAIAWQLSIYLSRRVEQPLREFAMSAERLGTGDARQITRRYGVPELDQVAAVLDRAGQRIGELIEAERRLTSEVSHQLRSPLTALSLQIEEIRELAHSPEDVRREADLASQQIERLTQVIEELVNLRRGDANLMTKLDLASAIAPVIAESRRALLVQSRALQVRVPRSLNVVAAQGGVRNILAVLLENALEHGRGTVTVAARTTGSWVVLSVADEGEGLSSDIGQLVSSGEIANRRNINRQSIGFPLAVMLAIAQEGRLEWLPSEPAVVRLYLRLSDENEAPVAIETEQGPESDADDIGGDVVSESVVETHHVMAQRETAQ